MKILLTVHQFLPDYCSGTEILALHSALELKSRGHDVQILTALPVPPDAAETQRFDRYEYDGLVVTRFRHSHVPMGEQRNAAEQEYNNQVVAARFERLVDDYRPDAVHFFHLMRLSASIVDVCWQRRLPTVLTPTDFWSICPMCQLRLPDGSMCPGPDSAAANCVRHIVTLKGPKAAAAILGSLPDPILRAAVRLAAAPPLRLLPAARQVAAVSRRKAFIAARLARIDRILVPTRTMASILLGHGLDPARCRQCSYGIRLPERAPAREGPGPLTIGVIGLGEHKGAHVLVQALRKLPGLDVVVRIYGRQSDYPDYVSRLIDLSAGDGRIEFRGTFANERIGTVLSELDALAVPSLWFENAPLVIAAAQAGGRPVIASDMPGIAELVTHGDNGLLFPAGDADRLAVLLAGLASDRRQLACLAARARRPKSISAYVDELLAVYGEIAQERTDRK